MSLYTVNVINLKPGTFILGRVMKNMRKTINKTFLIILILTTIYCSASVAYCILYGEPMSIIFTPEWYALDNWKFYQYAFAIGLFIFIAIFKKTRAKTYWFLIPIMLFITAYLYGFIVYMLYPCC